LLYTPLTVNQFYTDSSLGLSCLVLYLLPSLLLSRSTILLLSTILLGCYSLYCRVVNCNNDRLLLSGLVSYGVVMSYIERPPTPPTNPTHQPHHNPPTPPPPPPPYIDFSCTHRPDHEIPCLPQNTLLSLRLLVTICSTIYFFSLSMFTYMLGFIKILYRPRYSKRPHKNTENKFQKMLANFKKKKIRHFDMF
jgi:hypothetical protein